jgi:hypothetical protein
MLLFIPQSLRLKVMVPLISLEPVPLPETVSVSFSGLDTPRIGKLDVEGEAMNRRSFIQSIHQLREQHRRRHRCAFLDHRRKRIELFVQLLEQIRRTLKQKRGVIADREM